MHNAHTTRDWLYRHIPNSVPTNKCDACRVPQTLDHILNQCKHLETLRRHIATNKQKIADFKTLTRDRRENLLKLTYQKIGIPFIVRINKNEPTVSDLVQEYEEALMKYEDPKK